MTAPHWEMEKLLRRPHPMCRRDQTGQFTMLHSALNAEQSKTLTAVQQSVVLLVVGILHYNILTYKLCAVKVHYCQTFNTKCHIYSSFQNREFVDWATERILKNSSTQKKHPGDLPPMVPDLPPQPPGN